MNVQQQNYNCILRAHFRKLWTKKVATEEKQAEVTKNAQLGHIQENGGGGGGGCKALVRNGKHRNSGQ